MAALKWKRHPKHPKVYYTPDAGYSLDGRSGAWILDVFNGTSHSYVGRGGVESARVIRHANAAIAKSFAQNHHDHGFGGSGRAAKKDPRRYIPGKRWVEVVDIVNDRVTLRSRAGTLKQATAQFQKWKGKAHSGRVVQLVGETQGGYQAVSKAVGGPHGSRATGRKVLYGGDGPEDDALIASRSRHQSAARRRKEDALQMSEQAWRSAKDPAEKASWLGEVNRLRKQLGKKPLGRKAASPKSATALSAGKSKLTGVVYRVVSWHLDFGPTRTLPRNQGKDFKRLADARAYGAKVAKQRATTKRGAQAIIIRYEFSKGGTMLARDEWDSVHAPKKSAAKGRKASAAKKTCRNQHKKTGKFQKTNTKHTKRICFVPGK